MPFTRKQYPAVMERLAEDARLQAIRLANLFLDEGYDSDHAITIAVAQARHWALKPPDYFGRRPRRSRDQHVIPHPSGWAVMSANGRKIGIICTSEDEAVEHGRELARRMRSVLVLHRDTGEIRDQHNFMVWEGR